MSYAKKQRCGPAPEVLNVIPYLMSQKKHLKITHIAFFINLAHCADFEVLSVSNEQLQRTKTFSIY